MRSEIIRLEIWGMVFISIFGSLLHFVFDWLNRFWLAGAFSAVNESTWEHLKLAVVPAVLWLLLERYIFKIKSGNFWPAKAAGMWLMPALIILIFYSYTAILGYNFLVADISTFVLAVIIGQIISCKIMILPGFSPKLNLISIISIIALFLAFVVFTFYPPQFFLFLDPVSGGYGISN